MSIAMSKLRTDSDLRLRYAYSLAIKQFDLEAANEDPRFASFVGLNPSTANALRLFARRFSPRKLETLCKIRTPSGDALSWTIVRMLFTVESRERLSLAKKAAKLNWSPTQLEFEITRGRPISSRTGGPRPTVPSDPTESVNLFGRKLDSLIKRLELMQEASFGEVSKVDRDVLSVKINRAVRVIRNLQRRLGLVN